MLAPIGRLSVYRCSKYYSTIDRGLIFESKQLKQRPRGSHNLRLARHKRPKADDHRCWRGVSPSRSLSRFYISRRALIRSIKLSPRLSPVGVYCVFLVPNPTPPGKNKKPSSADVQGGAELPPPRASTPPQANSRYPEEQGDQREIGRTRQAALSQEV